MNHLKIIILNYEENNIYRWVDTSFDSRFLYNKRKKQVSKAINDPVSAVQYVIKKTKNLFIIIRTRDQYIKEERYIEMRDGVRLFTSIYSPKDQTEAYPILVWRTPYNIEPHEDKYSHRLLNMVHLVKEKYIIVFQDVRGRYMSEGEFIDIRPYNPYKIKNEIDENSDAYDTIDWLINNVANNNGKVGILGISYDGFYTTMAIPNAHPAIKAVSPQAPVTNWFLGDDWHHNGAFFLLDAFTFYANFGRPRPYPTRESPIPFEFKNMDNDNLFKAIEPIKNVQNDFFGDSIQFWSELMTHPNYDDFWKERNLLQYLNNINVAVLIVGGWFDAENLSGALQTYQAIEKQNMPNNQNRLIIGPWYHGQWAWEKGYKLGSINFGSNTSNYFKDLELQFFNYYLKDKGKLKIPEATIFITGANEWRTFDSWPPENVVTKNLYLGCDNQLSFTKTKIAECYNEYLVDPWKPIPYAEIVNQPGIKKYMIDDQRFVNHRPDVMIYQTEILTEDITLVGPLDINLFVSTTGTDADFVVKIIDVFPGHLNEYPPINKNQALTGYQMLVRGDVMRGKFRKSFETPEPFVPTEVTEVSFKIPDLAHQFKKGHRIMIQVQNSWFPLVDINPQNFIDIYSAEQKDFIKATHRIYHDTKRPSSISVSILNS